MSFPNKLEQNVRIIGERDDIGQRGNEAIANLREKGFVLAAGLTEYYAGAISSMGYQRHIREYCPRDVNPEKPEKSRFHSLQAVEKWIGKGRGTFLLLAGSEEGAPLFGYGWTGIELCEQLPDHPVTSAYRIGEQGRRRGLGPLLVQAVVSATHETYSDQGIGLETWESNHDAVRVYNRVGFTLEHRASQPELRPTLDENAPNGQVSDTRLYMAFRGDF